MIIGKRGKKGLIVALVMGVIGFHGCKREGDIKLTELKGGKFGGGVFTYVERSDPRSLFPPRVVEVIGARIVSNIYEGLVKLNPRSLLPEPALAAYWDIDTTGTVYTFVIRKGVKFHDSEIFEGGEGRELTVQDVKFTFDFLCSAHRLNQMSGYLKDVIRGCREFWEETRQIGSDISKWPAEGVSGVKIINDTVIRIELVRPVSYFLQIIAMPSMAIFPRELLEKYGDRVDFKAVGTGPFMLGLVERGQKIVLVRNPNYWGRDEYGNQLPYLSRIEAVIVPEERTALIKFERGEVDMIMHLPSESIDEIIGEGYTLKGRYIKYQMKRSEQLAVNYLGFLTSEPPFNDERVRKAFCMAIDREAIVKQIVKYRGIPGVYGIVPPAFVDYDAKGVSGCPYDPGEARRLLKEAGYENPADFPEITLYVNKDVSLNIQVAQVVENMLEQNLGVKIRIQTNMLSEHIDIIEKGKAKLFRWGWIADYVDPETFFKLFMSRHVKEGAYILNPTRYEDSVYDMMLDSAIMIQDRIQRYEVYKKLDQYITDRVPVIPLYYNVAIYLLQPNVRGIEINALGMLDFSKVYFIPG